MRANGNQLSLLIAAGVILAGIGGCPLPSGDTVLEGTWEVVPDEGFDGPLANLFITFDRSDQLSDVSYRFTNGATVTWHHPEGSTSVDEDTIDVTCTVGGNGFTYNGTLDSITAPTSADGALSLNLAMGNLSVSMPQGPATLIRQ